MSAMQIKRERMARDWTMEDVAKRVGVTKQAMHLIEKGVNKPLYAVLLKLENLFGKSHRELLEPLKSNQHQEGGKPCGTVKTAGRR